MKICAIICEFNPFHNGHAYLLKEARRLSGCDFVVCVMSGQFTQRGEICRTDKFLRAKHAVLGGADAVIELPTPFSVAPAEIFARGAVKLVAQINAQTTLAFGCESGNAEDFTGAAHILCGESGRFKQELAKGLDGGESYIKSYCAAFGACGGNTDFISSPNNILGVEYAKAALRRGGDIGIIPIKRVGCGYNDGKLEKNFSSAGAIRANAQDGLVKGNMPDYSYKDFIESRDLDERFGQLAADALFLCDERELKRVYGCTEGLENRLKKLASLKSEDLIAAACTKRYSQSRIRRILAANLLGLYADETESFLNARLPLKPLAVKKESADGLLPLLASENDPCAEAEKCARLTSRAYALWAHLNSPVGSINPNEKMILV